MLPREELHVPVVRRLTLGERVAKAILGISLAPVCWGVAHAWNVPGLGYQRRCAVLGIRLLLSRPWRESIRWAYELLFRPMDSTRYFEHDFIWSTLHPLAGSIRYLDVSSPRLVPIMLMMHNASLESDMINPDQHDLEQSRRLVSLLNLSHRCRLYQTTISNAPFEAEEFDIVTCMSVLEHIVDDREGLTNIWRLLRRGGRLVLTVPCKASASEQWIDKDVYGLQVPDERGFVFWQRYYDDRMLGDRIFSITGKPVRIVVYGEKREGTMAENIRRKRRDPLYPFWAEPVFMGREFMEWTSVSSLPGEGVVGMEFIKT